MIDWILYTWKLIIFEIAVGLLLISINYISCYEANNSFLFFFDIFLFSSKHKKMIIIIRLLYSIKPALDYIITNRFFFFISNLIIDFVYTIGSNRNLSDQCKPNRKFIHSI